jgi:hypothetical protein
MTLVAITIAVVGLSACENAETEQDAVGSALSAASTKTVVANTAREKTNSLDLIVSDMSELNDLPLLGVNPKYGFAKGPGYVVMGNDPRGVNTPDWHKKKYPHLINENYWNWLLPWFVHFEGVGNQATNVRIQMRSLKVFAKSKASGQWRQVNKSEVAGAIMCPHGSNYYHCEREGPLREEASGGVSARPANGFNYHGWWGSREKIDGSDLAAIMVTLQARLIPDNVDLPDDRPKAKLMMQVGADYYRSDAKADTVLPAVGLSRVRLLSSQWQSYSMTTFSDVGKQEPGGGISEKAFREDPPPLD